MPTLADWLPGYALPSSECEKAKREAYAFAGELLAGKNPRWLSLVGGSGVGKTFLAKMTLDFLKAQKTGLAAQFWSWGRVVDIMRKGDFGIFDHLVSLPVLVLDDIGASYESALSKAKLLEIGERRLGKWTIWTSNLMFDQIGEQIDVRLSSRMVRGNSRVVAFRKSKDFCLSNYQREINLN